MTALKKKLRKIAEKKKQEKVIQETGTEAFYDKQDKKKGEK